MNHADVSRLSAPIDRWAQRLLKRLIDVVGAAVLLVCTAPLWIIAAIAIKISSPGRVIFRQKRVGMNEELFVLFKFRTMRDGAEHQNGHIWPAENGVFFKLNDDPRIIPCGRLLRRFSIDELPQLINVLIGDMSLIGPRPISAVECTNLPAGVCQHRSSVEPGLSGLWQVSGRSNTTEEERIRLDLKYVDEWSIWMDVVIAFKTIPAVLKGTGAV